MISLQKVKAKTNSMVALYKNDMLFHDRLKVLQNITAVLANTTFFDLQALNTSINEHDDKLDMLDRNL